MERGSHFLAFCDLYLFCFKSSALFIKISNYSAFVVVIASGGTHLGVMRQKAICDVCLRACVCVCACACVCVCAKGGFDRMYGLLFMPVGVV